MADGTVDNERVVDLDAAGDELPALIEEAARRGERLIVERGGVRLAVLVPESESRQPGERQISDGEAVALLESIRARFADQTQEEIERETAKALAEARAEPRAERAARPKASCGSSSTPMSWHPGQLGILARR